MENLGAILAGDEFTINEATYGLVGQCLFGMTPPSIDLEALDDRIGASLPTYCRRCSMPSLSKSRFQSGLQCLKRLYLECYNRELADEIDAARQAIFDSGHVVGEKARLCFPGGRLVEESYLEHGRAVGTTKAMLADSSIPALYEAAVNFEGIRARFDVLVRRDGQGFDLVEVKSSTGVKDEHITDVAIQLYAAEGSGIAVDRAYLMHLNREYVYQGGEHDLEQLFTLADVTEAAREYVSQRVSGELAEMWETLELDSAPEIDTGKHCKKPYTCSFFGHCHRGEPEHSVMQLPRLGDSLLERLKGLGISSIGDIPSDLSGLSAVQSRIRDSVVGGRPYVGPGLRRSLGEIALPASFLDFETINPAIPLYIGTRPYERIPFQWSLHVLDGSGNLTHREFLNPDAEDPRERFASSLLETLPAAGSIVTYSSYEKTVINGLSQEFPEYRDGLLALNARMVDLLKVVRDGYYHPGFHGSFSIKSVLPALVPDSGYDELDVKEGLAASAAYSRLVSGDVPEDDEAELRESLLAYCKRDTEAMVRVYYRLLGESGG